MHNLTPPRHISTLPVSCLLLYIALIPRPTPLPGDVMGWLTTFCGCFTAMLPERDRADYLECVRERIKRHLCDATGKWTANYVRLRFVAHLTH